MLVYQIDVIYNVDQIYRRTRFGCFTNYGFAVLKVTVDFVSMFKCLAVAVVSVVKAINSQPLNLSSVSTELYRTYWWWQDGFCRI